MATELSAGILILMALFFIICMAAMRTIFSFPEYYTIYSISSLCKRGAPEAAPARWGKRFNTGNLCKRNG